MRKAIPVGMLVVVAVACGDAAGAILQDAGQAMMDAGNGMAPDAGAQTGECPCEAGPQGERGEQGPSGIVSATSLIPGSNPTATQPGTWVCEFGAAQLSVEAGQKLLITGQGTARYTGTGSGYGEVSLAVAWRKAGETAGEQGHAVSDWIDFVLSKSALHVTELTPPLTAGVYELGICVRKDSDWDSVTILSAYGTAMVINAGG